MSDPIQQAARCITANFDIRHRPLQLAEALAAAGLLVTPEQRAVLDAAEEIADSDPGGSFRVQAIRSLYAAVDALRAATPKDGES